MDKSGFPRIRDPSWEDPHSKDSRILGSIWRSPRVASKHSNRNNISSGYSTSTKINDGVPLFVEIAQGGFNRFAHGGAL